MNDPGLNAMISFVMVLFFTLSVVSFAVAGFISPRMRGSDEATRFQRVVYFKVRFLCIGAILAMFFFAMRIWSTAEAVVKALN